jgi:hypothetical protein
LAFSQCSQALHALLVLRGSIRTTATPANVAL